MPLPIFRKIISKLSPHFTNHFLKKIPLSIDTDTVEDYPQSVCLVDKGLVFNLNRGGSFDIIFLKIGIHIA